MMIRPGRERKLRRKIRLLKQSVSIPLKTDKVQKTPILAISKPVVDVFQEVSDSGIVKTVSADSMKKIYQGGRPDLRELERAGFVIRTA
jgi:hypothetical protein